MGDINKILRKKSISRMVLEALSEGVISTSSLIVAITASGYGASYGKMERNRLKAESEIREAISHELNRQSLYSTLHRLKRDGLIEKSDDDWAITRKGISRLFKIKPLSRNYVKEEDDSLKIVIFDIPEKYRRYRDWLRRMLLGLGFEMLQKSVWIGRVKLPKEFIIDLHNLEISKYVDVFVVTKTGTLRKI